MSLDFGNIVHVFPSTQQREYKPSWKTPLEICYTGRALQVCQSLRILGEAIASKNFELAAAECEEAIQNLATLKRQIMDGTLN
jgi:hypothetical protein